MVSHVVHVWCSANCHRKVRSVVETTHTNSKSTKSSCASDLCPGSYIVCALNKASLAKHDEIYKGGAFTL